MWNPYEHTGDNEGRFEPHDTSGCILISNERNRQFGQEGWTTEHDDEHSAGQMADAARAYIVAALRAERGTPQSHLPPPPPWPWDTQWWKPSDDPIRNLVKAGALIAAEIDRLHRANDDARYSRGKRSQ